MKFLNKFIIQAQKGELAVKSYSQFWDKYSYKVKISFGMGAPAKIPWISFLAPGMSTSQGFYPVYLYYKEQGVLILSFGISETHSFQGNYESQDFPNNWSSAITENYPKISEVVESPKRYGESFCFKKYSITLKQNEVNYLDEKGNDVDTVQLEKDLNEILEKYNKELNFIFDGPANINNKESIFSIESQLEDFIIENWENTVLSEKYELLIEDGEIMSQQFLAQGEEGNNYIDILVKDKIRGNYVVIELKKNQTNDDTIGQTLRYMGWVTKYLNDENVKGIIIAAKYDKKLNLALSMVPDIEAMTYEVDFKLKNYE